ncbi:MAG: dTDP-4-dehydrorhamnose reductase [Acidobacteriota bacterium]
MGASDGSESNAGGDRVVVFGGGGQVGQALLRNDFGNRAVALEHRQADLTDPDAIAAALDEHAPAAVINAAVFQPVDLCESEPSRAFAVNATGAGFLAAACRERGIRLVHISTDYVFDGARREPYTEKDCPAPLSVYARSKLAGEHLVLTADARHCVVRTCSVFGRPGRRGSLPFVERMLQRALAGEPTRVVVDQVLSPTYNEDLASALWLLADSDAVGLFHLAGGGEASWYDLAEEVFRRAGRLDLLSRTSAAEFAAPAPRASYSALTSVRLDELGIPPLPGWQDGLARHFADAHPEL